MLRQQLSDIRLCVDTLALVTDKLRRHNGEFGRYVYGDRAVEDQPELDWVAWLADRFGSEETSRDPTVSSAWRSRHSYTCQVI
jgi:hypothetical protein